MPNRRRTALHGAHGPSSSSDRLDRRNLRWEIWRSPRLFRLMHRGLLGPQVRVKLPRPPPSGVQQLRRCRGCHFSRGKGRVPWAITRNAFAGWERGSTMPPKWNRHTQGDGMRYRYSVLLASALSIGATQLASAADIPMKAPVYKAPAMAPASVFSWTGIMVAFSLAARGTSAIRARPIRSAPRHRSLAGTISPFRSATASTQA
jgi:hypothetical protein